MFYKKVPKEEEDDGLSQKVDHDLIVHNMPDQKRLAGNGLLTKTEASVGFQNPTPKNNFKKIGLLIIIGGFIVIGVLVYLSFKFIIKPATNSNVNTSENKQISNPVVETVPVPVPSEVIKISTTSEVATSVPIDLNISTTSVPDSSSLDTLSGSTTDQVLPLLDSDNDGLYDEEEVALDLKINSVDSDSDNYLDKTELEGNYNPNGAGKLEADSALTKYTNKESNYEILYPTLWSLKEVLVDNTVIFTAPDDSIIQVSIQDNPSHLDIMSWYADAFPTSFLTSDRLKSGVTWDGVMSEDNLNFYLSDKKNLKIYIISYLPIFSNRIAYPSLFKAMAYSIVLK